MTNFIQEYIYKTVTEALAQNVEPLTLWSNLNVINSSVRGVSFWNMLFDCTTDLTTWVLSLKFETLGELPIWDSVPIGHAVTKFQAMINLYSKLVCLNPIFFFDLFPTGSLFSNIETLLYRCLEHFIVLNSEFYFSDSHSSSSSSSSSSLSSLTANTNPGQTKPQVLTNQKENLLQWKTQMSMNCTVFANMYKIAMGLKDNGKYRFWNTRSPEISKGIKETDYGYAFHKKNVTAIIPFVVLPSNSITLFPTLFGKIGFFVHFTYLKCCLLYTSEMLMASAISIPISVEKFPLARFLNNLEAEQVRMLRSDNNEKEQLTGALKSTSSSTGKPKSELQFELMFEKIELQNSVYPVVSNVSNVLVSNVVSTSTLTPTGIEQPLAFTSLLPTVSSASVIGNPIVSKSKIKLKTTAPSAKLATNQKEEGGNIGNIELKSNLPGPTNSTSSAFTSMSTSMGSSTSLAISSSKRKIPIREIKEMKKKTTVQKEKAKEKISFKNSKQTLKNLQQQDNIEQQQQQQQDNVEQQQEQIRTHEKEKEDEKEKQKNQESQENVIESSESSEKTQSVQDLVFNSPLLSRSRSRSWSRDHSRSPSRLAKLPSRIPDQSADYQKEMQEIQQQIDLEENLGQNYKSKTKVTQKKRNNKKTSASMRFRSRSTIRSRSGPHSRSRSLSYSHSPPLRSCSRSRSRSDKRRDFSRSKSKSNEPKSPPTSTSIPMNSKHPRRKRKSHSNAKQSRSNSNQLKSPSNSPLRVSKHKGKRSKKHEKIEQQRQTQIQKMKNVESDIRKLSPPKTTKKIKRATQKIDSNMSNYFRRSTSLTRNQTISSKKVPLWPVRRFRRSMSVIEDRLSGARNNMRSNRKELLNIKKPFHQTSTFSTNKK